MIQIQIIDGYQYRNYEDLIRKVNQFCKDHDVIEIKTSMKEDIIIYSITYKEPKENYMGMKLDNNAKPYRIPDTNDPCECCYGGKEIINVCSSCINYDNFKGIKI